VESEACHFCEDAHRVLDDLARQFPVDVTTIAVTTPTGQRLMAAHRAGMSPLVLLDGTYFSQGRLPRRKLTKTLTARFGSTTNRTTEPVG
jgi:hypothetical protein